MWSLNGFINDLPLLYRRVKEVFRQVIRIRSVHSLKCFNIHLMLFATQCHSKFESSVQLQREETAEKSNESRKMLFIL